MKYLELNSPIIRVSDLSKVNRQRIQMGSDFFTVYKNNQKYWLAPDRCSHRGVRLEESHICSSGNLICPYHGRTQTPIAELTLAFECLWLKSPYSFFSDVSESFLFCGGTQKLLPAPFHVVLDNFNEGQHTPFVHKYLGPKVNQIKETDFSWSAKKDSVEINYRTPQKKNILFYGVNWDRTIEWTIHWRTKLNPAYMCYYSEWIDQKTNQNVIQKNLTYFFITPVGADQTMITSFVFAEPVGWTQYVPWLLKKMSVAMTTNQIKEDYEFYRKIKDLPKSLDGLKLEVYDEPLLEIRKRAQEYYSEYL